MWWELERGVTANSSPTCFLLQIELPEAHLPPERPSEGLAPGLR